jgi:hypothetical protein
MALFSMFIPPPRLGIFQHSSAKFRRIGRIESGTLKRRPHCGVFVVTVSLARLLPTVLPSINVFKAAVLSIAVALAGQHAALFCGVWCHSGETTRVQCEHQTESTSGVVGNDDCKADGAAIVFLREETRRGASAPDVQSAIVARPFAFTALVPGARSGFERGSRPLLQLRPLVLPLRI